MVRIYAEKTILDDLTHVEDKPAVNLNALPDEEAEEYKSAEDILQKPDMSDFDILSPEATKVSSVTTVTSETTEATTTSAPEEEETTVTTTEEKVTTEATTTTPPETEEKPTTPTTTEKEEEEEVIEEEEEEEVVEDNEEEEIPEEDDPEEEVVEEVEEHEELVTTAPEDEEFNAWVSSILKDIEEGNILTPEIQPEQNITYPMDNLISSDSWKNETLTIYNKKSGRNVTGNAFDIICGVTFNEVGTSMHPEAIKAQAIASYSYIKHYENKGEIARISMKTDIPQEIIDIVSQVDGLCIYYDDEPIRASFSASTGGYSSSSENVWGGEVPYLVSVKNEYDYLDTKHYGVVTTYTVDEVRDAIESNTDIKLSNNPENWIQVLERVDTVYAGQLAIDGHTEARVSGKNRALTGYVFRSYILSIRSTNFTVSYDNGVFTFVTYGYGHGVGMSQVGANLYATYGGYTFDQILHHYYTGVVIR